MIRLNKKTPLVEGLYVIKSGQYQIRLKDTQEVMSAVGTKEDLVRCGKLLISRYRYVESLRRKLSEGNQSVSPRELERRRSEESSALNSRLYRWWYATLTGTEEVPKRSLKKKIRLK